jgi:hypothetical protein
MNVGKGLVCSFSIIKPEVKGNADGKKKKIVPKYIN